MNWSDIGDAMFGGLPDYAEILALVSNSVWAGAVLGLVGGLIGNSMLALAALIGADARVPSMVLQRAPLGRRGSYVATVLNVAQCMGWAIFELIVIATAAGPTLP